MRGVAECSSTNTMDVQLLKVKILGPNGRAPSRASVGAAGYDIYSAEEVAIWPNDRALVSTQIALAIPEGHYGRIAPRSGLSVRGIDIAAGVIDSDYRGEVKVLICVNPSVESEHYKTLDIHIGDRIAQLILEKISTPPCDVVEELPESIRGAGGFGSTGV